MRFVRRVAATVVLGAILIAPSAALVAVIVSSQDVPAGVDRAATELVVSPTEQSETGQRDATVTVSFNTAQVILGTGGEGRITEVFIQPGDTVSAGTAIYSVNGVSRIADSPSMPYYRTLTLRSTGPDVIALNTLLATLGFEVDPNADTYSADTRSAVRFLRSLLGETKPADNFTPDLVVWIPDKTIVVDQVQITPNEPAPASSATIAKLAPRISVSTLALADGTAIPDALRLGPVTDSLTGTAIGPLTNTDGTVELNEDGQRIARTALANSESGTTARIDSTVQQAEPRSLLVVAATAVTTDPSGSSACVWRRTAGSWTPMSVDVTSATQPGTVAITGADVTSEIELLANPTEILAQTSCPSNS